MTTNKIKMFELVELTVTGNNPGRFTFVTQPQLRNQADQIIIIRGIKVYLDTVYSNSQVDASLVGFAATELPKAVLVLYINGQENVKMIPLAELVNINDGTNPHQQEIEDFADLNNVAWEKSYVQFSVAAAGAPYVIPFGIAYLRMQRDPSNPDNWIPAP